VEAAGLVVGDDGMRFTLAALPATS